MWLQTHAVRSKEEWVRAGRLDSSEATGPSLNYSAVTDPEDILVLAAGGDTGGYSVVIPGWSGKLHSQAVTKLIPPCASCKV